MRKWRQGVLVALVSAASMALPIASGADEPDTAPAPVDARVTSDIAARGEATFWVVLKDQADLSAAYEIADWAQRGEYVRSTLIEHAAASQAPIMDELAVRGLAVEPYWIANVIRVTGAQADLSAVAARADVREITADRVFALPEPTPAGELPTIDAVEWGVAAINAPAVWTSHGTGSGIVVAAIDTGVQFDHPALATKYRGYTSGAVDHSYNWFDPSGVCGAIPCDDHGHGTHVTGTMVGDDGGSNAIGVAPGARFIMAKGCGASFCSGSDLLASGQWILAPTDSAGSNPRADLRPHIVNNSWGGGSGDTWFLSIVEAWRAAGIFPVFANGNDGPSCATAGSPGDYSESYAVGAFDSSGAIAGFSSRGASTLGGVKPDIAAPGASIRSSLPGSTYASWKGTSMASPHVAGATAVLWSAAPSLVGDIVGTAAVLDATAIDVNDTSCGGSADDNNVWGEGKLDLQAAIAAAPTGPTGSITGIVTDAATSAAISGANVTLSGTVDVVTITDGVGAFSFPAVAVGNRTLNFMAFGYASASASVTVSENTATTADKALTPLPSHDLGGTVLTDGGTPMEGAVVTIAGTPITPQTTGVEGAFLFTDLPEGTTMVTVAAGACTTEASSTVELTADRLDISLSVTRRTDTFGHRCQVLSSAYIEASTVVTDALGTPFAGDDVSIAITPPFPVTLYGTSYTGGFLCSNGFLTFGSDSCPWSNQTIPSGSAPNAGVYPFWDDFVIDAEASVRTATLSGPDRFVVEWRNIRPWNDLSRRWDVEVIFHADGLFEFQYRNITDDGRERGNSATIGVENATGSDAFAVSIDVAWLETPASGVMIVPPRTVTAGDDESTIEAAETFSEPAPGVLADDVHSEGSTLTATVVTTSTGSLSLNSNGGFTYTPPAGFTGGDSFTYSACDIVGTCDDATVTLSVVDTTDPVITVTPGPTTHEAATPYSDPGATATDSLDGPTTVVTTGTVDVSTPGPHTLNYTATDNAGNKATATRTITVVDTTDPVITVAAGPSTHEAASPYSDPGATATDTLDGPTTVVTTGTVDVSTPGPHTLTYTATDNAGNKATATRTVTVVDTTDPVITVRGEEDLIHETGAPFIDPGADGVDALDGSVAVTVTGSVDGFSSGLYTLAYEAMDAAGNTTTVMRSVRVAHLCAGLPADIEGTDLADNLSGTSDDDVIWAGAGDDIVDAGAGNDIVCGGEGDDVLLGAGGNDIVHGGAGNDVLSGGRGADVLSGGRGANVIGGGNGNDRLLGGNGNDRIYGGYGDDQIFAGRGRDSIYDGGGNDMARGGGGNDIFFLGGGENRFDGGSGQDWISLRDARAPGFVDLGARKVELAGSRTRLISFERVLGSRFGDTIDGDARSNTLLGLGGADTIRGRGGDDLLNGGAGIDTLVGGAGTDSCHLGEILEGCAI